MICVCFRIIALYLTQGDWRKNHTANKDSLYVIEPVIESLLQVTELIIECLLLVRSYLIFVTNSTNNLFCHVAVSFLENSGDFF